MEDFFFISFMNIESMMTKFSHLLQIWWNFFLKKLSDHAHLLDFRIRTLLKIPLKCLFIYHSNPLCKINERKNVRVLLQLILHTEPLRLNVYG